MRNQHFLKFGLKISAGLISNNFSFLFVFIVQVFDITRKITYKNLATWYKELRDYREKIPCIVVANKIDGILSVRNFMC